MTSQGLRADQTVILLPFAQTMAEAKREWLRREPNGVLPRFETTHNWALSVQAWRPQALDVQGDAARDTATALHWLDELAGLRLSPQWQETLAAQLVQAAHSLAPAAAAQHPERRADWAQAMSEAVVGDGGALTRWETMVQRLAWLWVGQSTWATDVLWSDAVRARWPLLLHVAGWGEDALAQALLADWSTHGAGASVLPTPHWSAPGHGPRTVVCGDLHDEALEAATAVGQALAEGAQRVALVALDRELTRRTLALLSTRGIELRDETGWRLSTSRQAAAVMAVLAAAQPQANTDTWLNALMHVPAVPDDELHALERDWRAGGRWRPVAGADDPAWLSAARAALAALHEPRSWNRWQRDVVEALRALGLWTALEADAAGQRLIAVAMWQDTPREDLPKLWRHMSLTRYLAWLRSAWESAPFRPPFAADAPVLVVPMAQVLMRDVDAVVMPGCDAQRLPLAVQPPGPWTSEQRSAAGLPDRSGLTQGFARAWLALAQAPQLTVLWRTQEGSERLSASNWVLRMGWAAAHESGDEPAQAAPAHARPQSSLQPSPRPQPSLLDQDLCLLPARVSATRYQRLRACPYQFFVADVLGLSAAEELDELASRRDLGLWLHAVLQRFHEHEPEAVQADAQRGAERLDHWAQQVQAELGWDDAAFLPFAASWPPMRDAYLEWLHSHRATGARVWRLEQAWYGDLDEGLQVHGVLDRVDRSDLAETRLWVMDYKTERASAARKRARSGAEDTQLAFYAALAQQAQPQAQIEAAYLCVGEAKPDDRDGGTRWEAHPDVISDAQGVMQGVREDWQALRAGAPMAAIGESPACDHCAARGLCRRDLWGAAHA